LLPGVEARTSDDGELLVRGPNVMLGYWNRPDATSEVIDAEGWLHTGDKVRLDETRHIQVTGRLKDVLVLSNGEKLPPAELEAAISMDTLFEQVMVIGEGRPYLAALVVLNPEKLAALEEQLTQHEGAESTKQNEALEQQVLERIANQLTHFPGYAHIYKVHVEHEPWSVDNGLLTPTMKLRRSKIMEHYAAEIEKLYEGH
jgi:long-chain acyl-CoA synthetase